MDVAFELAGDSVTVWFLAALVVALFFLAVVFGRVVVDLVALHFGVVSLPAHLVAATVVS